jgi:hypothetical protein
MAAKFIDHMAALVPVRRFPGMGATDSCSFRSHNYVRTQHFVRRSTTYVPFRRFGGDVRREFMQRFSAALTSTLGSYLRDAFQEGSAGAVVCLPVPRALVFSSFLLFCLVASTTFSCKKITARFIRYLKHIKKT